MKPSLTVLLPLHNAEAIVESLALESIEILPDLTSQFDVVIVDDGSTDDTTGVANEIAQQYPQIRVIRHPSRLGPQAAARAGLATGDGALILWREERHAGGIRGIHRLMQVLPGHDLACGRIGSSEAKEAHSARDESVAMAETEQPLPDLYLARREVFEALPWPLWDRRSLEQNLYLNGYRWTETVLPARSAGFVRLPAMQPMFRQLAEQSHRIRAVFPPEGEVHAAEAQKAPNFLVRLKKFALGE